MQPTMELRWVLNSSGDLPTIRPLDASYSLRLQQKWVDPATGNSEWRDVPFNAP